MARKTRKHRKPSTTGRRVGKTFAAMMAIVAAASFGVAGIAHETPPTAPESAATTPAAPAPTQAPVEPPAPTQAPETPAPAVTPSGNVVPVVRVVDGDTLRVLTDGAERTVRIVGLDTPETVHPNRPVECYGPEASAEAKRILEDQTVQLIFDTSQGQTDRYGRTLAYVVLPDGTDFAEHMIRNGFAESYIYRGNLHDRWEAYEDAEMAAQTDDMGMWSACP